MITFQMYIDFQLTVMAPEISSKGKGKAGAKTPTSVVNRRLSIDRNPIQGLLSEHICGLIWIYNVCGVNDVRPWYLCNDIIILDPVTTLHFSQFQLRLPHRRSSSSPVREWWAAFRSYMGQLFDTTLDQMDNWRWDNPRAFGYQVDHSNPQKTSWGKVKPTGECVSLYGSDNPMAKVEPPSCRRYKPGDFLAVRPLNWDKIIDEDEDDGNCANPSAPSGGRSCPGDGNDNDDGESQEDMQGCENGTGKGKGTKDGKEKWKGKGKGKRKAKGNGKGKGSVRNTQGGDNISRAIAFQLQKEMLEADLVTEG
jgi:hypothetical protein